MTVNLIHLRSDLPKVVRQYFFDEDLLEVTTPTLGHYGVSDLNLDNLTQLHSSKNSSESSPRKYYLQTEPAELTLLSKVWFIPPG